MNPTPASRAFRAIVTLAIVLVAEIAAAAIIVIVAINLLVQTNAPVPWGAVGKTSVVMMIPAIMIWGLSLFLRTAGAFWILSVIICLAWSFLRYYESKVDGLVGAAIYDGFPSVVGFIVARQQFLP